MKFFWENKITFKCQWGMGLKIVDPSYILEGGGCQTNLDPSRRSNLFHASSMS